MVLGNPRLQLPHCKTCTGLKGERQFLDALVLRLEDMINTWRSLITKGWVSSTALAHSFQCILNSSGQWAPATEYGDCCCFQFFIQRKFYPANGYSPIWPLAEHIPCTSSQIQRTMESPVSSIKVWILNQ